MRLAGIPFAFNEASANRGARQARLRQGWRSFSNFDGLQVRLHAYLQVCARLEKAVPQASIKDKNPGRPLRFRPRPLSRFVVE